MRFFAILALVALTANLTSASPLAVSYTTRNKGAIQRRQDNPGDLLQPDGSGSGSISSNDNESGSQSVLDEPPAEESDKQVDDESQSPESSLGSALPVDSVLAATAPSSQPEESVGQETGTPLSDDPDRDVPPSDSGDNNVPPSDLGDNPVPSSESGTDAVPSSESGADAVPSSEPGDNPVPSPESGDDVTPASESGETTVPSSESGDSTVPSSESGDTTVPSSESGDDVVTSSESGEGAVPSSEPGDGAVPSSESGEGSEPSDPLADPSESLDSPAQNGTSSAPDSDPDSASSFTEGQDGENEALIGSTPVLDPESEGTANETSTEDGSADVPDPNILQSDLAGNDSQVIDSPSYPGQDFPSGNNPPRKKPGSNPNLGSPRLGGNSPGLPGGMEQRPKTVSNWKDEDIDRSRLAHPTPQVYQDLVYFGQYAAAAYCPYNSQNTGKKVSCASYVCDDLSDADIIGGNYQPLMNIPQYAKAKWSITYFVAVDTQKQAVIVSFSGTNPQSQGELINALRGIWQAPADNVGCSGCQASWSFMEIWKGVKNDVVKVLNNRKQKEYRIILTGHSAGAAVATIAAGDLRTGNDLGEKPSSIDLYSYASPRTGDPNFADWITKQGNVNGQNFRLSHFKDPVTRLPAQVSQPSRKVDKWLHIAPEYYIPGAGPTSGSAEVDLLDGVFDTSRRLVNESMSGTLGWDFTKFDIQAHRIYLTQMSGASC